LWQSFERLQDEGESVNPCLRRGGFPASHRVQQRRRPCHDQGRTVSQIPSTHGSLTAIRLDSCGPDRAWIALGADHPRQAAWELHGGTSPRRRPEAHWIGPGSWSSNRRRSFRMRTPATSLPLPSRTARAFWSGHVHGTGLTGVWPTNRGAVGSTPSSLPPAGTRRRARRGSWQKHSGERTLKKTVEKCRAQDLLTKVG
jgi:hypothetical protein